MDIEWQSMLLPSVSLAEIFIRGTVVYLAIFLFVRVLPPREVGGLTVSDLLVVVLIADAAQNGMSAQYQSITEGLLLVLTIIFWSYCIDLVDFYFPRLNIASHAPVQLIRHGAWIQRNMHRQKITEEEVMSQIRQCGLDSIADIKSVYIEGDGHISVIMTSQSPIARSTRNRPNI